MDYDGGGGPRGPGGEDPPSVVGTMMREFTDMRGKMKGEDEEYFVSPFAGIEKSSVLQEATQAFNDSKTVRHDPVKCRNLITKLLFLLAQGESFVGAEASDIFFAVTKLFQSQDHHLRRMTYLFLKEVAESTDVAEIIIVTASLMRDMNSQVELFRANAIRVLTKIIDADMLNQNERYLKQAIVDKDPLVSSSALVAGNQMVDDPAKRDVVKRWLSEIQEVVHSRNQMPQYHALSLLYHIKAHDRLAISKLVTQLTRTNPKSPLAVCLLVRYTCQLIHEEMSATDARAAYEFLESCLRHKNEMVVYEAARAICRLPGVASQDMVPAISVLQLFLSSPKPTLRFASVRTLNEVAAKQPMAVARCNEDMEALIHDGNRSIATLAITTLLKTGNENSIERLMKQITTFMNEIGDEFKIVVVRAVRSLSLKYPRKHRVLLNFLSSVLRDEGGFDFKKTIVDTVMEMVTNITGAAEPGLFHLCELIEDCEFTQLSVEILHVLGEMGPDTSSPAKFVRYIYNRVILENAHVRSAAVSAMVRFGIKVPSLRRNILILLRRCLHDEDDEVRDRAILAVRILEKEDEATAKSVLLEPLPMKPEQLAKSLELYKQRPANGPLSFEALPVVEEPEVRDHAPKSSEEEDDEEGEGGEEDRATGSALGSRSGVPGTKSGAGSAGAAAESQSSFAEELYKIPEFAQLGPLFKSCSPVALTESETEYLVRVTKHIFSKHVVLQFNLTNTLDDQLLSDVKVALEEVDTDVWEISDVLPCPRLPYDITKSCYVSLQRRNADAPLQPTSFACELVFKSHVVDPKTAEVEEGDEGYDDTYAMEDVDLGASDFMAKLTISDFATAWQMMGTTAEQSENFQLSQYATLEEAVTAVIDFLAMQPCEGTAAFVKNSTKHTLLLAGQFVGGYKVLAHAVLVQSQAADGSNGDILLKIVVRSENETITRTVLDCIL